MEYTDKEYCLEVWGDMACFTRPELKVERVSYDVITPSAARAIFEAIFWKPAIHWQITKIEVLKPIKWTSVRRNEVGAVAGKSVIFIEEKRQQKNTLLLKDAYGYPVYFMISEGQRNDINYAIPLLDHVDTNGSNVLADRGYDSNKLIDYIYTHGGEPTIPSRKGAKFDRYCDWWLYKERHLVENYFLKLKAFRRITTRYDKLASTFLGIICIASILIWLK